MTADPYRKQPPSTSERQSVEVSPTNLHHDDTVTINPHDDQEAVSAASFELNEVALTPTPQFPPNQWQPMDFGKYELVREIGRGGMGVVYMARQKDLDRVVALKMILSNHLASTEQVSRFYAEARSAARLRYPHIVRIHEVGEHRGQHYFAMEYVAGQSLAQLLRQGAVSTPDAVQLLVTVARAVHYLHTQGMVHRDLKPSNILLDEAGQPWVTDFGLAKVLDSDERMTHSGAILGTPGYMAPEQAAPSRSASACVGPLSDVYSLGTILYECLTGRPPFGYDAPLETLVQVLEGEPPRPRDLNPSIPLVLEQICLKCLEKSPEARYASAADFADDLERFLRGEQVEASRVGPWQMLRRWARREPALVSRLGTMAVCGVIIQLNLFVIGTPDPAARRSIFVVLAWAAVSLILSRVLHFERWGNLGRGGWATADIGFFTLLVLVNDGLNTSLVAGYFLLVIASGLWFRERLVWLTTFLAVSAYGVLVLSKGLEAPLESPYRYFLFATALAIAGLIVSYQVRRVRALSYFYEHRPYL